MTDELKFRQDNPGGDWLKKHQKNAENDMKKSSPNTAHKAGVVGKVTGYYNKSLHLHNHGKSKTMNESFGTFFKNKRKRSEPIPKGKSLEDIHDEYTDATMHYLNQVHKLTHPDSPWHKVIAKLGGNSRYVKDLHDDVKNLIDKHGDKT